MQSAKPTDRSNPLYYLLRQLGGDSGDVTLLALGFLVGALAFLWAGFLGDPTSPSPLFHAPWSLYIFFCGIMVVVEASILLDPKLPKRWQPSRARVVATLAVTGVCIVIVAIVYIAGWGKITSFITHVLPWLYPSLTWLRHNPQVVFTTANLFCIVVLWLGVRFATYDREAAAGGRATFHGERLVGDLALSAILSIILAFVFFEPFWTASKWTVCDLTYLPYQSPCQLSPIDSTTLFILDALILPVLYVIAGLVILGLAAWREAIRLGRAYEYVGVFLESLSDILRRRVTIPNLLLALRYIWPLLALLATVLVGLAARASGYYLHSVSIASHGSVFWVDSYVSILNWQFGGVVALAAALVATVSATTMQIVPRTLHGVDLRRDLMLAWRHFGFWAGMFAVSYWLFSVVFTLINWLIVFVSSIIAREAGGSPYTQTPFVQPDPLMLLSLIVFVVFTVRYLRRKRAAPDAA